VRIERRLTESRWLLVAVPVASLCAALLAAGVVLLVTGHDPLAAYGRLFERGFFAEGALTSTLITATPLLMTGLAAAAAFRMQVWNIGAEGQLYLGAIAAAGAGLALRELPGVLIIPAMVLAGLAGGALWGVVPGLLRAYFRTNEIITSLMLNYVAGLLLTYLIFDSHSYWRELATFTARQFPQGKTLPAAAAWPALFSGSGITLPFGFLLGAAAAALLWVLYRSTRFGFEVRVIGDSPAAAHYAGISIRRKIVAVMALSGALAGLGGASEIGDFQHVLDPRGLQQAAFGYTGIVIAALARFNPLAVVLVAVLLGGLTNAGFSLQGRDFPAGLVGVLQGMILFFALGGELLVHHRVRFRAPAPTSQALAPTA
jgi:simple sugar transport system permease protein